MSTLASDAIAASATRSPVRHESPARRAWRRFRSNRLGYWSLVTLAVLFSLSMAAELLSNDKPLVARYNGQWYFPVFQTLPEYRCWRVLRAWTPRSDLLTSAQSWLR